MKQFSNIPLFFVIGLISACAPKVQEIDEAKVLAKSTEVANLFQSKLQTQLGAAMKSGGAMAGIEVCHQAAPAIAKEVSEQSGAKVSRIALKTRNPSATPDEIAKGHLESFVTAPLNADKTPKSVIYSTKENGVEYVNFMRAIPLKAEPCATCHGTNIDPKLLDKIKTYYPMDNATGFKEGDLRGAILVSWPKDLLNK